MRARAARGIAALALAASPVFAQAESRGPDYAVAPVVYPLELVSSLRATYWSGADSFWYLWVGIPFEAELGNALPSRHRIGATVLSPDGRRLASVTKWDGNHDGRLTWDDNNVLWLESLEASDRRRLTLSSEDVQYFVWSHDSRWLAVCLGTGRKGAGRLAFYDVEKGSFASPGAGAPADLLPGHATGSWSPDSRRFAFATEGLRLTVAAPDGTPVQSLPGTLSDGDRYWTWSPDSSRLVYEDAGGAWRIARPGGEIVPALDALPAGISHVQLASLSPDNRRLAFTARSGGDLRSLLFVSSLDGSDAAVPAASRADEPGDATGPSWSPDGRRIAFGVLKPPRKAEMRVISVAP